MSASSRMRSAGGLFTAIVAFAGVGAALVASPAHAQLAPSARTTVVMLGTGTPIPDPDRFGPAVAVVVDSVAYLFDAGSGVMRRAAAAARDGVSALEAPRISTLFLTHLHSDHTLGLADVLFTPWIQGRRAPLALYGPPGTARLVAGILDGNALDIAERIRSAGGPAAGGERADVHEVAEGEVYRDARVVVRAFRVPHSAWEHAFGYRIETPDRVIVISGDTRASDAVVRACNGCDLLIHEVYAEAGFQTIPEGRKPYHAQAHTSAPQLARLATAARPRLLVLTHQLFFGASEATLLAEVRAGYAGAVVSARDLQRYE